MIRRPLTLIEFTPDQEEKIRQFALSIQQTLASPVENNRTRSVAIADLDSPLQTILPNSPSWSSTDAEEIPMDLE